MVVLNTLHWFSAGARGLVSKEGLDAMYAPAPKDAAAFLSYGVGISACAWLEYTLSVPLLSTAVTT